MRTGIQRLGVPHAENPRGVLTVSAGLSMLHPEKTRSASAVLKEADEALYRAKQRGRNRVEHVEPGDDDKSADDLAKTQLIGRAEFIDPAGSRTPDN